MSLNKGIRYIGFLCIMPDSRSLSTEIVERMIRGVAPSEICLLLGEMVMKGTAFLLAVVVAGATIAFAPAQEAAGFKVAKVELVPNSEQDLKTSTFYRDRPIIQAAPSADKGGEPLKLPTYRSY